jgi:death-on-curing protein
MRYLTLGEVVALHRAILEATGGASGIRDLGALESALAPATRQLRWR